MRYFFIALLVFVGAVAFVPSLRERVLPGVKATLDSRRIEAAATRIDQIVALTEKRGAQLTPAAQFKAFVDRGLQNEPKAGTDPWGTAYYLKRDKFNYWVGSAGPDKAVGTDDDIVSQRKPLPDNRYRGRRR
jgi:hypothetical protein